MRIYISGPITGNIEAREQFNDAAEVLAERDIDYVNPAALSEVIPGAGWSQYMGLCYSLLGWCNAIVFLDGWKKSAGAKKERKWAADLGLIEYDLETGKFREIVDAEPV